MTDGEKINELRCQLGAMVASVDYLGGACTMNEMVGAVLPREVLLAAKFALESTRPAKVVPGANG